MPIASVATTVSTFFVCCSQRAIRRGLAVPATRPLLLLILSLTLPWIHAEWGFADDGDEFLKKSLATHAASDTISYSAVATARVTLPAPAASSSPTRTEIHVRRHKELLEFQTRNYHRDKSKDHVIRYRHTFGNEYKVGYAVSGGMRQVETSAPSSGIVWKEDLADERAKFLGYVSNLGCWLDGYVATGDQRVPDVLLAADRREATSVTVDGETFLRVAGKTEYGAITLWLNPHQDYLVNRVVVQKGAGDLLWPGRRVADESVSSSYFITKSTVAYEAEMVVSEVQQVGNIWVAKSGTLTVTDRYTDGSTLRRVVEITRADIDLHPQLPEDAFQTDLAVGARVHFIDQAGTGVSHVWNGKKPVVSFERFKSKQDALLD